MTATPYDSTCSYHAHAADHLAHSAINRFALGQGDQPEQRYGGILNSDACSWMETGQAIMSLGLAGLGIGVVSITIQIGRGKARVAEVKRGAG